MKLQVRVFDSKVKHGFNRYLFQCSLATLVLFLILTLEGAHLSKAIVIAAIASTAFVVFVTPHSTTATPRHVIGGHFICLAIGSAFSIFDGTSIGQSILSVTPILFDLEAALAVGLGIFLMAATDTEHAPAAGTALGLVAHNFSFGLVFFLAAGVVLLSITHVLLRSRLRDLL